MDRFPGWDEGVEHLGRVDPVLRDLIASFPNERLVPRARGFETLIRAIVGQQISVKAAQSVWDRFVACCGEVSPSSIMAQSSEELRACGLSGRKVEYVQGIAGEPQRVDSESLGRLTDDEVLGELTSYRGVGPWTAEMFMIFTLCRPDVLSLKDIGLRRAVESQYGDGQRMTDEQITLIAEPWRPWRSVATWYLWRSLDPIPVEY